MDTPLGCSIVIAANRARPEIVVDVHVPENDVELVDVPSTCCSIVIPAAGAVYVPLALIVFAAVDTADVPCTEIHPDPAIVFAASEGDDVPSHPTTLPVALIVLAAALIADEPLPMNVKNPVAAIVFTATVMELVPV